MKHWLARLFSREEMITVSKRVWNFNSKGYSLCIDTSTKIKKVMKSDNTADHKIELIQAIMEEKRLIYKTKILRYLDLPS